MLYRLLRAVNRAYPFVIFWGYVGLFLLSLPFMFIFPFLPLVLVMFAAMSVVFVFAGRKLLVMPELALARRALRRGACPACGEFVVSAGGDTDAHWHCVSCGTLFATNGEEIESSRDITSEAPVDHEARIA